MCGAEAPPLRDEPGHDGRRAAVAAGLQARYDVVAIRPRASVSLAMAC
jgi:hypothetical protein